MHQQPKFPLGKLLHRCFPQKVTGITTDIYTGLTAERSMTSCKIWKAVSATRKVTPAKPHQALAMATVTNTWQHSSIGIGIGISFDFDAWTGIGISMDLLVVSRALVMWSEFVMRVGWATGKMIASGHCHGVSHVGDSNPKCRHCRHQHTGILKLPPAPKVPSSR